MKYLIQNIPKKFFTLIELLVVIAVIAILASMLLPALRSAREQAKETLCKGNLKQCGLMLQMYASDYSEFIPPEGNDTFTWASLLYDNNYTSNWDITHCPSLPPFYIVNPYGMDPGAPFKINSYPKASERLILVDSVYTGNMRQCMNVYWSGGTRIIHARHALKANVLYADAHVDSRKSPNMKFPVFTSSWQMKDWVCLEQ